MDEGFGYLILAVVVIGLIIAAIVALLYIGLFIIVGIAVVGAVAGCVVALKNFFAVLEEAHTAVPGPPGTSKRLYYTFAGMFSVVLVAIAVAALGYIIRPGATSVVAGRTAPATSMSPGSSALSAAPEFIIDNGACPFEGCQYGVEWLALKDVATYTMHPSAPSAPATSLGQALRIPQGTWVSVESGVVVAQKHIVRLTDRGRRDLGDAGSDLPVGTSIAAYTSLGEGCVRALVKTNLVVLCDYEWNDNTPWGDEWWVQLRMADGRRSWALASDSFIARSGLNDQLVRAIESDAFSALEGRLAEIDRVIAMGGDLNGDVPLGVSPSYAAFTAGDIPLLEALLSRGLSIDRGCAAYSAMQGAMRPGGEKALRFLLERGMSLRCLTEPPLVALFRSGIATSTYSVDQKMVVADVLMAYGASPGQRNAQGEDLFVALRRGLDSQWWPNVEAVRRALEQASLTDGRMRRVPVVHESAQ